MKTELNRVRLFQRRAMIIGSTQAFIATLLAGRLGYLSVAQSMKYSLQADENRINYRFITPRRGLIVDRNNTVIAQNRRNFRIAVVPAQVQDMDTMLQKIGNIIPLTSRDIKKFKSQVAKAPKHALVQIGGSLSWEEFSIVNLRIPFLRGIHPLSGYIRYLPKGTPFAHLVGYVGPPTNVDIEQQGSDSTLTIPGYQIGKLGLEKLYEKSLQGKPGVIRLEVNATGRMVRELDRLGDKQGQAIKLTIDSDLQIFASERLGEEAGAVVVIDCLTGDLLCMASTPAYDPNDFSDGIAHDIWNDLRNDRRHPLLSKTVQSMLPPGSTIKPIVALAALRSGIDPKARVRCRGSHRFGRRLFHCWKSGGHGQVDLLSSLSKSCDVYYYILAEKIGIEPIAAAAREFGLGTQFDIPVTHQKTGIVPDAEWKMKRYQQKWQGGDTLNAAIGQGYFLVTPLQLAVMSARIASGTSVTPRLIYDPNPPSRFAPLNFTAEQLNLAHLGMYNVVNQRGGTAIRSKLEMKDLFMAGKTGTAQVRRITRAERRSGVIRNKDLDWALRDHALFVSFAPFEQPRYACAVVVNHGGSGSGVAAPIARDVLTHVLERLAPKADPKAGKEHSGQNA